MKAVEYFNNGFSCSESIVKWAMDKGYVNSDSELLSVATSFSGGMLSGCLCGAIAGSQMVIGYLFGRENKNGNEVIARNLAKEFVEKFTDKYKATCCRALTKGLIGGTPERKAHCSNMVDECSKFLEQIISEHSKIKEV